MSVTRLAFFLSTGKWPTHNVCHKCDIGICVRFSHFFDGTQKENMDDCVAKVDGDLAEKTLVLVFGGG